MLNVSFLVRRFYRRLSFLLFVLFSPILSQKRITTIPDVDVAPFLFRFADTVEMSQLIDSAGGKFELVNQFVNIRKRIKSKQLAHQVHSLVELVRPNVPMRPVQSLLEPRQIKSKHFNSTFRQSPSALSVPTDTRTHTPTRGHRQTICCHRTTCQLIPS